MEYQLNTETFNSSTYGCCYFSVQLSKPCIKEKLQFIAAWVFCLVVFVIISVKYNILIVHAEIWETLLNKSPTGQ